MLSDRRLDFVIRAGRLNDVGQRHPPQQVGHDAESDHGHARQQRQRDHGHPDGGRFTLKGANADERRERRRHRHLVGRLARLHGDLKAAGVGPCAAPAAVAGFVVHQLAKGDRGRGVVRQELFELRVNDVPDPRGFRFLVRRLRARRGAAVEDLVIADQCRAGGSLKPALRARLLPVHFLRERDLPLLEVGFDVQVVRESEKGGGRHHRADHQQQGTGESIVATQLGPGSHLADTGRPRRQQKVRDEPDDDRHRHADDGRRDHLGTGSDDRPQDEAGHTHHRDRAVPRTPQGIRPEPRSAAPQHQQHGRKPAGHVQGLHRQRRGRPFQDERTGLLFVVQRDDGPSGDDGRFHVGAVRAAPIRRVQRALAA